MGFAEFASFTCQLDEETIKQHVTAMVGVGYVEKHHHTSHAELISVDVIKPQITLCIFVLLQQQ